MKYAVTNRLRPLRIGILSGLDSPQAFVSCVEVSTMLWGAIHNPIFPALVTTERWGENPFRGAMAPADVLKRWQRNFDADIFMRMDDASTDLQPHVPMTLHGNMQTMTDWRTIHADNNGSNEHGIRYGISTLEIARSFSREHLWRGPSTQLVSPAIVDHPALSAALFGCFDDFVAARYHEILGTLGHQRIEVDVDQALRYASPSFLTPLAVAEHGLRSAYRSRREFYAINEEDPADLALFWNVRAAEPGVVPITNELLRDDQLLAQLLAQIASDPDAAGSRRIYYGTLASRDVSSIVDRLHLPDPNVTFLLAPVRSDEGPSPFTPDVYSLETRTTAAGEPTWVTIEVEHPQGGNTERGIGMPYANEVALRSLDSDELPADAIPFEALESYVGNQPAQWWRTPWRVADSGFTFFPFQASDAIRFEPPNARLIIAAYLRHAGYASEISEQGLLLLQLLKRIGNGSAGGVLTHSALQSVIEELDGRGTMEAGKFKSLLSQHQLPYDSVLAMMDILVTSNVLAQGMVQRCPQCNQHPWFALDSLSSALLCEYCRGTFKARFYGDHYLKPAFRILPPLDLRRNRAGLVTALAVVNFLRHALPSDRLTISAGVKVELNPGPQEFDLIALSSGMVGSRELRLLLCECSANLPFDDADFQRFERALSNFPGACFVFATLRDDISLGERQRIVAFARTAPRRDGIRHRVIVLTGRDLMPSGDRAKPGFHGATLSYFIDNHAID
jgi:hypothetical protein